MRRWWWRVTIVTVMLGSLELAAYLSWSALVRGQQTSLTPFPVNAQVSFKYFGEPYVATTNELGFFDLPIQPRLQNKSGRARIALVGDSMTQGFGVPPAESFATQLQTQLAGKADVFQFAYVGAGPGHLHCVLDRLAAQFSIDHVVFISYLPNDFSDATREWQRPCFWWQNGGHARADFPYSLQLWRSWTAPVLLRNEIVTEVSWARVMMGLVGFLGRAYSEDALGDGLVAFASSIQTLLSQDGRALAQVIAHDRFAQLPHSLQAKILRLEVYPYTVLAAFNQPQALCASTQSDQDSSVRAYFAKLQAALSVSAKTGSKRFTVIAIGAPSDYDSESMDRLAELGFDRTCAARPVSVRLAQLRHWAASLTGKPGLVPRILDATETLKRAALAGGPLLIPYDLHFNRRGHLVMADWLAREFE